MQSIAAELWDLNWGAASLHQFPFLANEKLLLLNFPVLKVHRAPPIDAVFVLKWKDACFAPTSRSPHRSAGARSCRGEKIISKVKYSALMHKTLLDDPEELELKEGLELDVGLETDKAGLELDEELDDDDDPKLIWPETEE